MKLFSRGEKPSWLVSLIPFVFLIAILVIVIKVFGADALSGGSQVALLMASGVVVAISMIFYKIPWKEFEEGIVDNIRAVGSSILILLLIGAVAGSWMVSGVVPTMIYYGMKVIFPEIFLFAACGICAFDIAYIRSIRFILRSMAMPRIATLCRSWWATHHLSCTLRSTSTTTARVTPTP